MSNNYNRGLLNHALIKQHYIKMKNVFFENSIYLLKQKFSLLLKYHGIKSIVLETAMIPNSLFI